jgi:hypothetical protein
MAARDDTHNELVIARPAPGASVTSIDSRHPGAAIVEIRLDRGHKVAAHRKTGGARLQHVPHPCVAPQQPVPDRRTEHQQTITGSARADVRGAETMGRMVDDDRPMSAEGRLPIGVERLPRRFLVNALAQQDAHGAGTGLRESHLVTEPLRDDLGLFLAAGEREHPELATHSGERARGRANAPAPGTSVPICGRWRERRRPLTLASRRSTLPMGGGREEQGDERE